MIIFETEIPYQVMMAIVNLST